MREEPIDEQVAEAVGKCIEAMKGPVPVEHLEPGDVDIWLAKCTKKNFKENFGLWKTSREQVLEASRAIGRIAEILAVLDGSGQIGKAHLKHAIIAVREHCLVGADAGDEKRALCPDEDDMPIELAGEGGARPR